MLLYCEKKQQIQKHPILIRLCDYQTSENLNATNKKDSQLFDIRCIQLIREEYSSSLVPIFVVSTKCIDTWVLIFMVSTKCIDTWVLIFMVSTKCIDTWVLIFMVSNTTGNNQWENCIRWILIFVGLLSEPRNQQKLEPHD